MMRKLDRNTEEIRAETEAINRRTDEMKAEFQEIIATIERKTDQIRQETEEYAERTRAIEQKTDQMMKEERAAREEFSRRTDEMIEESKAAREEFSRRTDEMKAEFQEIIATIERKTDQIRQETEEYAERTRAIEQKTDQMMKEERAAREEFSRRTDKISEDGEAARKEFNKRWGELANKFGTLVEDIVVPNLPGIARDVFGFTDIDDFMVRRLIRNKRDRSKRREFDVIVVGDVDDETGKKRIIINETKSHVRKDYINSFIEALEELPEYFPEYRDAVIIPIFASLYIPEEMVKYLTSHRIYAMVMGEGTMDIVNFQQLQAGETGDPNGRFSGKRTD